MTSTPPQPPPTTRSAVYLVSTNRNSPESGIEFVESQPLPECPAGSCIIRMELAPINPSDINVLEGTYPNRPPSLPAVVGMEGCGIVVSTNPEGGSGGEAVRVGDLVVAKRGWNWGSWCSFAVMPMDEVYVLDKRIDPKLAAMIMVNPPTAYGLLSTAKRGDWVIQNAANSGMGISVIQVAKARGIKTINIVRREGLEETLQEAGADVVLVFKGERDGNEKQRMVDMAAQVKELLKGQKLLLAINAVCGLSGELVAKCLSPNGTILTYGVMSKEPMVVSGAQLLFKGVTYKGFHLNMLREEGRWDEMWSFITEAAKEGKITAPPVERTYDLKDIKEAVKRAKESGRGGKILLNLKA